MPSKPKHRPYQQRSQWRVHLDQLLPNKEPPAHDINVGQRLKDLRKARGISQRALADLSGLNFNTLSLIENNKSSPNVSTLQQIADALTVPVTAFFEVPVEERHPVVFQKVGTQARTAFAQGVFADLSGGVSLGQGTPLLMILDPNQDSGGDPIVHTGQEFVYCLSGEMVYWVNDDEYRLAPGDSLIFESHIPHRWANQTDEEARAVLVICPTEHQDRSVIKHLPAEEDE